MKATLSKMVLLLVAISLFMSCAGTPKTQRSGNLGRDLGISYLASVTTVGTETQYGLSHKGTTSGTIVGSHGFGAYLVKENFTIDTFLDGKPVGAGVVTLTAEVQRDKGSGEGVQILWLPNLISSTGAFMFEFVRCVKGCESSTMSSISGSLYAGIISGPVNPPITLKGLTSGYYAIRFYEFRTLSPLSNWLVFQVK